MSIFKIIGGLGILLISVGIISKKRLTQDVLYMAGGICLEIYSIYLQDGIFIILQIIFILSALFDLIKLKHNKENKIE